MINTTPIILIVDDTPLNINLLEHVLEAAGYTIMSAENGHDARAIVQNIKPDMILLDVMMPVEDGFTTCKILKENPDTSEIPIIFITAATDTDSMMEGLSIGGLDYITKPFHPPEVLVRVKNYLKLYFSYHRVIEEQAKRLQQVQDAQQTILVKPEDEPEANFFVHYLPILEAGGDFYDVFQIAPDNFGYFVSDISGHDLAASFTTSALKALVQVNSSSLYQPDETIRLINRVLANIFSNGQHLTAIYCHYNRQTKKLLVSNAAHPPLVIISSAGSVRCIKADGDIIGAFAAGLYNSQEVQLQEGDRFFLFTDGLLERTQPLRTRDIGLNEFIKTALICHSLPLKKAIYKLINTMVPPNGQSEDDILLMGVEA